MRRQALCVQPSIFQEEERQPIAELPEGALLTKDRAQTELLRQIAEINPREADAVTFIPTAVIFAALPHRQLKTPDGKYQTHFVRRTPKLTLRLGTMSPELGLPSGAYGRLIFAYLTSTAIRRGSRKFELPGRMTDLMQELRLKGNGRQRVLFRQQFEAIRNTMIKFEWQHILEGEAGTTYRMRHDLLSPLITSCVVWDKIKPGQQHNDEGYCIELSKYFYDEICQNSVPMDLRALSLLQSSPLAMDLYAWVTYQASYLTSAKFIRWENLLAQFGSYGRSRDFKKRFILAVRRVMEVFPEFRPQELPDGIMINPMRRTAVPRTAGKMRERLQVEKIGMVETNDPILDIAAIQTQDDIFYDEQAKAVESVEHEPVQKPKRTRKPSAIKASSKDTKPKEATPTTKPKTKRKPRAKSKFQVNVALLKQSGH